MVVIGAGPAGTTLAYELAKRGTRVLVIEKERLPHIRFAPVVSVSKLQTRLVSTSGLW